MKSSRVLDQSDHSLVGLHRSWVNGLATTPQGLMVTVSMDSRAAVLDLRRRDQRHRSPQYVGHTSLVLALALDPTGRAAFTGCFDGTLTMTPLVAWPPKPLRHARVEGAVWCLAFSADVDGLLVGTEGGDVLCWEPTAPEGAAVEILWPAAHDGPVLAIFVDHESGTVVSGGADGAVKVWSGRSCVKAWRGSPDVYCVAKVGEQVVSGGSDCSVTVHKIGVGGGGQPRPLVLRGHHGSVIALLCLPTSDKQGLEGLLSGALDSTYFYLILSYHHHLLFLLYLLTGVFYNL